MQKTTFTKKAQVLLTEDQFRVLQKEARRQKKKLGTILRDAFEHFYVQRHRDEQIREACKKLLQLKAPATKWESFEEEYIRHKYSDHV